MAEGEEEREEEAMPYKMTTVVRRFNDPKNNVPRELLACGHVRTDPILYHENEAAFKIKRLLEILSPNIPIKARCHQCAKKQ